MTDPWLLIGLAAQLVFTSRFIVQWYVSERRGRSVIPLSFWYISLFGSLTLLAYAIHRRDPVFIIGQGSGCFIYLRNLVLIDRQRRALAGKPPRRTPWTAFAAMFLPLVILTALCVEWVAEYRSAQRTPPPEFYHAESKRIEAAVEQAFIRELRGERVEVWALGLHPRLKLASSVDEVSHPVVTLLNVDGDDVEVGGKIVDCRREVLTSGVRLRLTLSPRAEAEVYVEKRVLPQMTFYVGSDPRRNQTSFGWFLETVSGESPDFAVLLGDEANSSRDHEYAVVEDRLLETRVPFFLLPGDSEYHADRELKSYRAHFGPLNHVFATEQAVFVFINTAADLIRPAAMEEAKRALETHRSLPLKFILMHLPIASFPGTDDVTTLSFDDTQRLLKLCRDYRVTCVFSGEVRGCTQRNIDGTQFFACGGLDIPSAADNAPHRFSALRVDIRDGAATVRIVDTDLLRGRWHLDNFRTLYYYGRHYSQENPVAFLLTVLALILWIWLPVMTIHRFRHRKRMNKADATRVEPPSSETAS